jgi:hypothetical protein
VATKPIDRLHLNIPDIVKLRARPAPGAQHDSIDEAREDADADGTRSILDIDDVSEAPPVTIDPWLHTCSRAGAPYPV